MAGYEIVDIVRSERQVMRIMTANIMEKHSQMQCERYTIDTDRLVQRLQQKKEIGRAHV